MTGLPRAFKLSLLGLSLLHLVTWGIATVAELAGSNGLLFADGTPVGGDFINMFAAARLVLSGDLAPIYQPEAFMAFERTLTGGAEIGLRLWAYPPHSLLLIWPLGWLGFYPALVAFSLVGLVVLGYGARRIGFDAIETAIILTSPAVCACLYFGQTGNFAAGLLLMALSARGRLNAPTILAASLLTIKPQTGFLLPVFLAFRRRWATIAAVAMAVFVLAGASLLVFGVPAWRDYLTATLPVLDKLERFGTGSFMVMMPSAFMAFRILTGDGSLAGTLHLVLAALVGAFVVWRLCRNADLTAQQALVLIGTVLMTPYMHNYDLAVLLAGALLVARLHPGNIAVCVLALLAWSLPETVVVLNGSGMPLSPLLILPLLVAAGLPQLFRRRPAAVPMTSM
jgi:hypothetical protein